MRPHVRPIGEFSPRWRWFKIGGVIEIEGFPRLVVGLGILSFELHVMPWQWGWEINTYIGCPLGYAGVAIEFSEEEENEEVS